MEANALSSLGAEVPGRMVSSLGRLRTQTGRIHHGTLRNDYLAARYGSLSGSRVESVHRLVVIGYCPFWFATKFRTLTCQPQRWRQTEQRCCKP